MLRLCSLFILMMVSVAQADIRGAARVIDGDTVQVAGTTVRLFGIDAPETRQDCEGSGRTWPCGAWASEELARLIGGRQLVCAAIEADRYGRTVARCTVDGHDLAAAMVSAGAAFAYRRYSIDYVVHERDAQQAERGLWSRETAGTPAPAHWRGAIRQASAQPAPGDCAIKGNISANGRIYHLPGQRDYERTRINTDRGEQWFCTEAEARAAGWRRALR